MANAHLEVNDGLGQRIVPITKAQIMIGRRAESDLRHKLLTDLMRVADASGLTLGKGMERAPK